MAWLDVTAVASLFSVHTNTGQPGILWYMVAGELFEIGLHYSGPTCKRKVAFQSPEGTIWS